MLIVYEREKIVDFIGSQESKINFLQKFNRIAYFDTNFSQFFSAGVYQLEGGPSIIVLPWFLKQNQALLTDNSLLKSNLGFFEVIKEIKSFKETAIDLSKESNKSYALDIVVHSYLINLKNQVSDLLSFNYHEDVTEKTNVIKGRWDVPKDMYNGSRPVKFTCTYNSFEINTPLFLFIKNFSKYLATLLKSRKNLILIDDILDLLKDVDNVQFNRKLVQDAHLWIKPLKDSEKLVPILDFAESLILDKSVYSKGVGISYQFQMDKFFEQLVSNFLKTKSDLTVLPQTREDLLGGAVWKSMEENFAFESDQRKAQQYTIPDIVAFDSNKYLIFECKYKPLRIPYINSDDANQDLSSFSRDDRNQLLSFIMSVRPSPELRNKSINFILIFPCNFIEKFKVTELNFESAKLYVDPIVRNLIQNRIKAESGKGLSIKFLGISISHMVESVLMKNAAAVNDVILHTIGSIPLENSTTHSESNFERVVQKRVALTALIVNKAKSDPTMGRVKLAKILYLADSHLKLSLQGQYQREAAGPLDARFIYNEKWGIETQGSKQSFFRRVETRVGNRYVPGTNIGLAIERANSLFIDKIDNINWLIALFARLDTERAEIVTTLYACWNDLLNKRTTVTDEQIVEDFRLNWHESKLRFEKGRLLIALMWMKENDLIPDGSGPTCIPKPEKIPSGF